MKNQALAEPRASTPPPTFKMVINPVIFILVMVFGSSSWLSTNSVWVEMSLLTQTLPEGWSLPSYLALIVQIACVGPLVYSLILKCTRLTVSAPPIIIMLLVVCTIAEFMLAFFWPRTLYFFGAEHSATLFVLMFLMALVNSTSNVLFMPYMATFHSAYLTAYFVGMGFSSLIPSLVALMQGTSQYKCVHDMSNSSSSVGAAYPVFSPPRFEVQSYTLVMAAWMMLAALAFIVLHFFYDRIAKATTRSNDEEETNAHEHSPLRGRALSATSRSEVDERVSYRRYCILITCLAFICAQMNAVVPSVQSYATMSYSMVAYHMALTLSSLAHPAASFLPMWLKPRDTRTLVTLTGVATLFVAIIFGLALQSPTPVWHNSYFGTIFTVAVSIAQAFVCAYLRTVLTSVLREDAPEDADRLFWCGVYMQLGSFIGSIVMFPLVNVTNLFTSAPLCR